MLLTGETTIKNCFDASPIDGATRQNQICLPEFSWEWQGVSRKHVMSTHGHNRCSSVGVGGSE